MKRVVRFASTFLLGLWVTADPACAASRASVAEDTFTQLLETRLGEAGDFKRIGPAPLLLFRELQGTVAADKLENYSYGFKLSFFAWGERGSLAQETAMAQRSADFKWIYEQNLLLLDVYREAFEYQSQLEELDILAERVLFLEKRNEILRSYVKLGKANIDDLLKAELEIIQTQTLQTQRRSQVKLEDDLTLQKLPSLKVSDFSQMKKAWAVFQKSHEAVVPLKLAILQSEQAKNMMAADRAQAARWRLLDSVGAELDHKNDYTVKVTFNIPLGDERDSEAFQQRVTAATDLIKFRREKKSVLEARALLDSQLGSAFEEARVLSKIVAQRQSSPRLIRKGVSTQDPQIIVESKLLVLEAQLRLLEAQKKVSFLYLAWLAEFGILTDRPLKNYLAVK